MGHNFDFEFRISNCEFGKQRAEDRRDCCYPLFVRSVAMNCCDNFYDFCDLYDFYDLNEFAGSERWNDLNGVSKGERTTDHGRL